MTAYMTANFETEAKAVAFAELLTASGSFSIEIGRTYGPETWSARWVPPCAQCTSERQAIRRCFTCGEAYCKWCVAHVCA